MMRPDQNMLADMLRYKRPAGSPADCSFRQKFLEPLGTSYDKHGNMFLHIPGAPIIWSSHTDTVHAKSGRQDVFIKSDRSGCIATSTGTCLGADCTTGVFIMMCMIYAKVPGMYVFHYGEERGCIGSKALTSDKNNESILKSYKACIAFDRRGYNDVITHQHGMRCCSDTFADSLAKQLGPKYSGTSGVYTDSAEYTNLIGECTNISVGYFSQHTASEWQDVDFALWLANRMCEIDTKQLVYSRTAGDYESEWGTYRYGGYSGNGYYRGGSVVKHVPTTMYGVVDEYPFAISKMLQEMGASVEDVLKYCNNERSHRIGTIPKDVDDHSDIYRMFGDI